MNRADIAIVGGGIAGLTAATEAARRGLRVLLFERAERIGGRSISTREGGFTFNLGPHALYDSHFRKALHDFDVPFHGTTPARNRFAERDGKFHRLPITASAVATTRLFGVRDRLDFLQAFTRIMKAKGEYLDELSTTLVSEWLDANVRRPRARAAAESLFRLASYANAPGITSMDAVAAQTMAGTVLYVDNGWQELANGLREAAQRSGAKIRSGARVERVAAADSGYELTLGNGEQVEARSVIVAVEPADAARIVEGPAGGTIERWAKATVPIRAACLDVALAKLPNPRRPWVLSVETPHYFSVHSSYAKLAPAGGGTVSAVRYLAPGEDGMAAEAELEQFVDLIQPGWRDELVYRRFMPALVVASDIPKAASGGMAGRPGPAVPGAPGLFVAGDWVGREGLLADASAASGRAAAGLAAKLLADPASPVRGRVSIPA